MELVGDDTRRPYNLGCCWNPTTTFRGGTGKPDLREMLIDVNQPQGTRVHG
jgi:hypothetical protein